MPDDLERRQRRFCAEIAQGPDGRVPPDRSVLSCLAGLH
jgi:hypothetical protein